jgi:hypothetical protein
MATSIQILSNSLYTNYPIIRGYINLLRLQNKSLKKENQNSEDESNRFHRNTRSVLPLYTESYPTRQ